MATNPHLDSSTDRLPGPAWTFLSPATETDAQLMRRAALGNRLAYIALFSRLHDRLWSLAYLMLHDADRASEAVQRTYVLGLDQLPAAPEGEPRAWFAGLALGVCRAASPNVATEGGLAGYAGQASASPSGEPRIEARASHRGVTLVLRREAARQLTVALGFLREREREVFLLRYVEGLSYADIAPILGIDAAEARATGHRARETLRENLGRDFPVAFPP